MTRLELNNYHVTLRVRLSVDARGDAGAAEAAEALVQELGSEVLDTEVLSVACEGGAEPEAGAGEYDEHD